MASAAFYAQINFYTSSALDTVPSGQIGIGAKSDGLYAKSNSLESRLLVVADIGVNVAAYSHTHNYDNYQYWDCKVGLTTTHIASGYTLEHYAGTGMNLSVSNPSQNVSRITYAISDDVVRKSGTPVQYCIPIFSNDNTIISDTSLKYYYGSRQLVFGYSPADMATQFEIYCHSTTSSDTCKIQGIRSDANYAISAGYEILSISARGYYSLDNAHLVGEIRFAAKNDFSSSEGGTVYSLKTMQAGTQLNLAIRHFISGDGLTRINGGLIAGTISSDPVSTLKSTGSFGAKITSTTGNLTLTSAHFSVVITGSHTITLPSASTCTGRIYVIANKTSASRTISTYTTLSGGTSTSISSYSSIIIQSDGSVWHQIN